MASVTIYGAAWCGECHRTKAFLDSQNITYNYINIESVDGASEKVIEINSGNRSIPTLLFEDGTTLTEPTKEELKQKLKGLGVL